MKKLLTLLLLLPFHLGAQNILRVTVKDSITRQLLFGSTALLKGSNKGANADLNGNIEIRNIPDGKQTIVFRYVGYESREIAYVFPLNVPSKEETILLKPVSQQLEEVVVTSTRNNSRIESIPIRVEVIGKEEVDEEANIKPANISKLLLESTSLQAQQTSAVNGNVSIRLLGLDGKYTQILKDGFPLFSGFAQGLSVLEIPPLDLKQVEIIKGSASSLYGSDAIAGIINLISKKPLEQPELTLLLNQTSLSGTDANAYFSQRWKRFGMSFLTSNNFQKAVDVDKDGFSDLPKTATFNLAPTFYYYIDPTATLLFGLNGTIDTRRGGDMKGIGAQPDPSLYYFEENISNRFFTQLKFDKQFENGQNFILKNSISYYDRTINQSTGSFKGKQVSSYTEASYNFSYKKHTFVGGLNLNTEKFLEDGQQGNQQRDYTYQTTGLFIQDDWKPLPKIAVQAGLRSDWQNRFGSFLLPRLALMYTFNDRFYMRLGSGLGYKVPGIFSTESELVGINLIQPLSSSILAERSIGSNLDFNFKTRLDDETVLTFNQSFFVTQINHPLVLSGYQFVNKDQPLVTRGFESNGRLVVDEFQLSAGYTFIDAHRKYDNVQSFIPLTPKHKVNLDVIYEIENNISFAFEAIYLSPMFRDGDTKTKEYYTLGVVLQKYFKHFTLVANCENMLDVRQSRFENIVIPPYVTPEFRQIYAPLNGRLFNVALRFKL